MPNSSPVRISKTRNLFGGAAQFQVEVSGARDADVLQSLIANAPFPDRDIRLGRVSLEAGGGRDIDFPSAAGKVSFRGSGSAFSSLGVYRSASKAFDDLRPDEEISPGITFPKDGDQRYVVLRWGYGLEGHGKGSLGLGAGGGVTFGADGRKEGAFAVVRRLETNVGARDALAEAVNSWVIPTQVTSAGQLEPGTWILAEVDGSFGATVGVTYGYDFHWIRETKLGALRGDIGLRLQMGAAAALGFSASGRYAIAISREAVDPVLRLRLYRLAMNGWKFAFDLKATAQTDLSKFLPGRTDADEFIQAVFGVHGAQIVQDLKAVEQWSDPDSDPAGALAGLSSRYLQRLVQELTGIDPKTEFTRARSRLLEFTHKWDALPHRVATLVWKMVEDKVDLGQARQILALVSGASDQKLRSELARRLEGIEFFHTPAGRLIEDLAGRGILAALNNVEALKQVRQGAAAVLELLDAGPVEELLERLQTLVEDRLKLDKVREIAETDFDQLDEWLQAKLAAFLDEKLNLARFRDIRAAIHEVLEKRHEFYQAAVKAATRKYEASIAYTYERAQERTALFDVSFDFAGNDPSAMLQRAVSGDFDELLLSRTPGVTLNTAELTHGIRRSAAVEIALPYFEKTTTAISKSFARLRAIDDDSGRVLLYQLESKDTLLEVVKGKMSRDSSLTIAGSWHAELNNQVRIHSRDTLSYAFSFRQASTDMKTVELERLLEPYVSEYFPERFGAVTNGGASRSFNTFLRNLDDYIEELEHNGVNTFGDTLIALELSLPGPVLEPWIRAPGNKKDPAYFDMSRAIQGALKEMIPFYFFADRRNLRAGADAVAPLLVWASIPPATKGKSDIFWNWPDREEQRKKAEDPRTQMNLRGRLEEIHRLLRERPEPEFVKLAGDYRPDGATVGRLIGTALKGKRTLLESLLFVEAELIEKARAAGLKMAEFQRTKSAKPAEAVRALAEFGAKLTDAFHRRVRSVYGGGALRPLGTRIFIEAAKALSQDPAIHDTKPDAVLYLAVVKEGAKFPLDRFLENELPAKDQLVVEQKLVRLESSLRAFL
jgi:hypothetical protein